MSILKLHLALSFHINICNFKLNMDKFFIHKHLSSASSVPNIHFLDEK